MYHNDQAIPAIVPLVGPDTIVLTLQNGIENGDRLAATLGRSHVMVGVAFVQSRIREPGVIEQAGQIGRIVFGEMDRGLSDRGQRLLELFKGSGWNVELSDNAMAALWEKFIYLTGSAGVNAVTQTKFGEMRTVPETRELIRRAYQEIVEVGRANGAPMREDILEWCMTALDGFPSEGMTSLANDFRLGNRVELEGLTGTVVRMGRQLGVPTPVHDTIYALLRPAAVRIEETYRHE